MSLVARTHNLVPVFWQQSVTNYLASRKVREVGICVCVCGLSATVAFNEPHASYQAWCSTNALIRPHGGQGSTDRAPPPHTRTTSPPSTHPTQHPDHPPSPFFLLSALLSVRNILERNCESKGFLSFFTKREPEREKDGRRDLSGKRERKGWRVGAR